MGKIDRLAPWPSEHSQSAAFAIVRCIYPPPVKNHVSRNVLIVATSIAHTQNFTVPWQIDRRLVFWPPLMWVKLELRSRGGIPKAQALCAIVPHIYRPWVGIEYLETDVKLIVAVVRTRDCTVLWPNYHRVVS